MRSGVLLLCLAGVGLAWSGELKKESEAAQIERLVRSLGSRRHAEREQAMTALLHKDGPAVVAALRKAAASRDPEQRRRAGEVLDQLQRREESARLLRPEPIRMVYLDVPVAEAIADFARRTGMPVQISPDHTAKLAGRKVTLDTGETTHWDALAQLARAAGLVEQVPEPPRRSDVYNELAFARRQRVIWLDGSQSTLGQLNGYQIVLVDGAASPRPTHIAGPVRISALPPPLNQDKTKAKPAEVARVQLTVDTTPALTWRRVASLRIDRAVDDQGQVLVQPGVYTDVEPTPSGTHGELVILWDGHTQMSSQRTRQAPVELRLGPKPARRIVRMSGVLAAEVETPREPLVTVDNILRASGKTTAGPQESSVKVIEAKADESGQYLLKVEVRSPHNDTDPTQALGVRLWRVNQGAETGTVNLSPADVTGRGLELLDADGQPFALATGHCDRTDSPSQPQVYTLYYQPRRRQGPPATLVYSGRRVAVVEVPFTLKDVPLE